MASKIVILGIYNDPNLGDKLLCLTAAALIKGLAKDCETEISDLYGRESLSPEYSRTKEENKSRSASLSPIHPLFCKTVKALPFGSYRMREYVRYIAWKTDPSREKRLRKYYSEKINGADLVIVPGGGLIENSLEHDYYNCLLLIAKLCEKKNIPLCYNAVGVVNDKRASLGDKLLSKALSSKSVKYISCRDGAEVIEKYSGRKPETVCCSAALSSQLFGIKKDEGSRRIGIGVIREDAFTAYGYDMPPERLLSFYAGLVRTFENMGYEPILFCNGYIKDYEFGQKVEKRVGRKILLKRPEEPKELIEQISLFKAVCAARLHAVIAAYSLDIPAVALSWGTKQRDFFANALCEERAISVQNMTAPYVASMTREAIRYGWNRERRREYMRTGFESIKQILKTGGIIDGE